MSCIALRPAPRASPGWETSPNTSFSRTCQVTDAEQRQRVVSSKPGGDESFVDAVTGYRVECACGVADQQRSSAGEYRRRRPHRQTVAS